MTTLERILINMGMICSLIGLLMLQAGQQGPTQVTNEGSDNVQITGTITGVRDTPSSWILLIDGVDNPIVAERSVHVSKGDVVRVYAKRKGNQSHIAAQTIEGGSHWR